MKNYNMILTEAAKISALSSGKIDRYDYLMNILLLSDQRKVIEQAKFT